MKCVFLRYVNTGIPTTFVTYLLVMKLKSRNSSGDSAHPMNSKPLTLNDYNLVPLKVSLYVPSLYCSKDSFL